MAMFMLTLDEPLGATEAEWNSYEQKRDVWVAATLKTQGLKEIRFYVNPHETSPTVLGCYEFDSLDSIHHMISSDDFKRIMDKISSGWLRLKGLNRLSQIRSKDDFVFDAKMDNFFSGDFT